MDATRGLGDFSDDLYALVGALELRERKIHLVGWSMGGTIAVRYAMDYPNEVASMTLINPMSPLRIRGDETPPALRAGLITPAPGEGLPVPSLQDA